MLKIGNLTFEKGIFLAPMAGVSDVGFREVCELCGAEMCYTEMVSAKGLYYGSERTEEMLSFAPCVKYKAVQIFGNDAYIMGEIVKSFGKKYDLIDINMGCPAPKIFGNKEGCYLMSDLATAENIIRECVKNSEVPITVKFRLGINKSNINAVEFAQMCERAGASAITVHGRTRSDFYSGTVDYEKIKNVVDAVSIPVIGNGDIVDKESYEKMLLTGCAGVSIGRGAMGNPQIFSLLKGITPPLTKAESLKQHIYRLQQYFSDDFINKNMRKHLLWYLHSIPNIKQLKAKIVTLDSLNESLSLALSVLEPQK